MKIIDSSLWVDLTRARTPKAVRSFVVQHATSADAHIVLPIRFEMLRNASPSEYRLLENYFSVCPILATPPSFWDDAIALGQALRSIRRTVKPFDLLISAIAIRHDVEVVTFDSDFVTIAKVSPLRVLLLTRPTP